MPLKSKSPPIPPGFEHDPRILVWRLDQHQERIEALEARPSLPDFTQPMWGRLFLALILLLIGSLGHYPAAEKLAMRLLGGS